MSYNNSKIKMKKDCYLNAKLDELTSHYKNITKNSLPKINYRKIKKCDNCNKEFNTGEMIVPEIRIGEGWEDRYFCCEECIRGYKNID